MLASFALLWKWCLLGLAFFVPLYGGANITDPFSDPRLWVFLGVGGHMELMEAACVNLKKSAVEMNVQTYNGFELLSEASYGTVASRLGLVAQTCGCARRTLTPKRVKLVQNRLRAVLVGKGFGFLERFELFRTLQRWGPALFGMLESCVTSIQRLLTSRPRELDDQLAKRLSSYSACFFTRHLITAAIGKLDAGDAGGGETTFRWANRAARLCINEAGHDIFATGIFKLLARFAESWTVDAVTSFQAGGGPVACLGNCLEDGGMPRVIVRNRRAGKFNYYADNIAVVALSATWMPAPQGSPGRYVLELLLFPFFDSAFHQLQSQKFLTTAGWSGYLFMVSIAQDTFSWAADCAWDTPDAGSSSNEKAKADVGAKATAGAAAGTHVSRGITMARQSGVMLHWSTEHANALRVTCTLPRTLPTRLPDGSGTAPVSLRLRFYEARNIVAELPLTVRTAEVPPRKPTVGSRRPRSPHRDRPVRLSVCTAPLWNLWNVEAIWTGIISTWLRYHLALNISRFVVYDIDGSFGDVARSFLAGPYGHRVTYFPRFPDTLSPDVLGPLSRSTAPNALFYLAQQHCRATLQEALLGDASRDQWLLTLATFDMWLQNPRRPGAGVGDLLAAYGVDRDGGAPPVVLRIRDVHIGLNTTARLHSTAAVSAAKETAKLKEAPVNRQSLTNQTKTAVNGTAGKATSGEQSVAVMETFDRSNSNATRRSASSSSTGGSTTISSNSSTVDIAAIPANSAASKDGGGGVLPPRPNAPLASGHTAETVPPPQPASAMKPSMSAEIPVKRCPEDVRISRGCYEGESRRGGLPTTLFRQHVFVSPKPDSWFCISRVSADVWIEDHDVVGRVGDRQIDIPDKEWRLLHYEDMIAHRCRVCTERYDGMAREMRVL